MYTTPGNNPDQLSSEIIAAWNAVLSRLFEGQILLARDETDPPSSRAWMYNPISNGGGQTASKIVDWTAFPKTIKTEHNTPDDAWADADRNRDNQEEYCEWEVLRDQAGRIVRITATCETIDYFTFLASVAKEVLLTLYQKYVSAQVQMDDLIVDGRYNARNKWNWPQNGGTHGNIMHMAQTNNSFGAAVNLAAIASWPRVDGKGQQITGEQSLIACRPFGVAGRHSDPHIGAEVNALVRAGNEVSFADPVGLYIDSIDSQGWELPDDSQAKDWYRVERGTEDEMLRVVFEAPAGSKFTLADLKVRGEELLFGGQIIDCLKIRLTGIARKASETAPNLPCAQTSQFQLAGVSPDNAETAQAMRLRRSIRHTD